MNECDLKLFVALLKEMFWSIPLAVLVVWFGFRLFCQPRLRSLINKLAGPPGYPFIGNLLDFLVPDSEINEVSIKIFRQYHRKGIMKAWLVNRAIVFVFSARGSENILNSTTQIKKSMEYDHLQPWLGTGLLTSTGDKWRSRRKLLTPAFHFRILDDFMGVYNDQSEIFVQRLADKVGATPFDLCPFISHCTLDIICESVMGRHVNAQKDCDSPYVRAVNTITRIIHTRNVSPWLWSDWIFPLTQVGKEHRKCLQILHSFTEQVIRERRQDCKSKENHQLTENEDVIGEKPRLAFLDLLIQASDDGRVLNDLDIREEVDTFMFEGHDTTSSGLTSALFLLGTHPEIQRKVQEEIDAVLGETGRRLTLHDLKALKYLECCIKESLRLFPPVPGIAREISEDIDVDGQIIPAGATVILSIHMLHRDPQHYTDPEIYNPDRFLPENSHGRHPFVFVPFSAGPRNCIGQKFALVELKVILAHILRSYTIEAMEKVKPENLKIFTQLILRPQNGLNVKLHPR